MSELAIKSRLSVQSVLAPSVATATRAVWSWTVDHSFWKDLVCTCNSRFAGSMAGETVEMGIGIVFRGKEKLKSLEAGVYDATAHELPGEREGL